jgi:hypothetical protein
VASRRSGGGSQHGDQQSGKIYATSQAEVSQEAIAACVSALVNVVLRQLKKEALDFRY